MPNTSNIKEKDDDDDNDASILNIQTTKITEKKKIQNTFNTRFNFFSS